MKASECFNAAELHPLVDGADYEILGPVSGRDNVNHPQL
jgi:hypothetical protein